MFALSRRVKAKDMDVPHGSPHTHLIAAALALLVILTACNGEPASVSVSAQSGEPLPSASTGAPAEVAIEVEVDGVGIKGTCYGSRPAGAPAVLYAHGIGGDYTDIGLFREHFSERTVVCGYSRAGVGASDPPAEVPRPVADVVAEMKAVLEAAEIPPPYFLVGFSGGGSIVQMYAQAYPDEVVGFVSINPSPAYTQWTDAARDILSPQEFQTNELDWYAGMNDEGIDMRGTDSMLTDPLPESMPYAVMFDEDCGGDETLCARLRDPLAESTALLADVGEGGRFVWVQGAGHDIDLTEPDRVRETLDEIWDEAS